MTRRARRRAERRTPGVRPSGMRSVMRLAGPVLLLAAVGCAPIGPDRMVADPAQNTLTVGHDPGDGTGRQDWTLTCGDTPTGTHPDPDGACDALTGRPAPFDPLPQGAVCAQQYGGPQTARIAGVWQGQQVEKNLSRTDGCGIAEWDAFVPVVPAA